MAGTAVALTGVKLAAKTALRQSARIAARVAARSAARSALTAARSAARSSARAGARAVRLAARSVRQRGLSGAIKNAGTRALQNSPQAQRVFSGVQSGIKTTSDTLNKLAQLATVSSATLMALKLSGNLTPEQEKELEELNGKLQKTNTDAQKLNSNLIATDQAMTNVTAG